ncbi:unnamed protein product [Peniophora sp. CBMAI 1063]|nr:unnamed protein product [Peniophora sp. CBMAI 1063]
MSRTVSRTGSGSSSASFTQYTLTDLFCSPKSGKPPKRPADAEVETPRKRLRILRQRNGSERGDAMDIDMDAGVEKMMAMIDNGDEDSDEEPVHCAAVRRPTVDHLMRASASLRPGRFSQRFIPSTRPLLASLASSDTTDRYLCPSTTPDVFTTPPYACVYSHTAKRGGDQRLAVSTEQGVVYVWNTSSDCHAGAQRLDLPAHGNGIFDVRWSLDDTRLATASADHTSRIIDVRTGAILSELHSGHTATVKTLTWDPSHDSLLATGGRDGVVCLWDLRTASEVGPAARIAHAHEELLGTGQRRSKKKGSTRAVTGLLFSSHAPHSLISAGPANGLLRLWDLRTCSGTKKRSDRESSTPARMSPEDPTARGSALGRGRGLTSLTSGPSNLLFALGCDSRVHAYEPGTLAPLRAELGHEKLSTNSFYAPLGLSECGRWAAAGGADGSVVVFDVDNVGRPGRSVDDRGVLLNGHGEAEITGVSWAQDVLATCADDGTVRVWRDCTERRSVNGGIGSADLVWAIV